MNKNIEFSIMSYSFHGLLNVGAMNIFGYLETVKFRYGLNTADIWNCFLESYRPGYVAMLKDNIDERGLKVVNFCCDMAHVWDNDPETRKKNEETAWQCIETAEALGAKTIRIDAGVRDANFSDEQIVYVSGKYKEYCKKAASFGAKLGTENHWGATLRIENVELLFKNVGMENFGLLLHLGRWNEAEADKKEQNDLQMASRAMHIHLDFNKCLEADRYLPPVLASGYGGCWSVEAGGSENEYNNAAFMLAQAKRVLNPLNYDGAWKDGPPSVKG